MTQPDPYPEPDSIIFVYVLVLVVLIMLSSFFSASETAFTSLNRSRLKTRMQDDRRTPSQQRKSEKALKMSDDFDRILFTLLVGNNIVNITASTIATLLFMKLISGNEGLASTLSTIVITVVVLVFGEITPKTLAKERPEAFAENFCGLIKLFTYVLWPICIIFTGLKKLLVKVFKLTKSEGVTEEEILNIVEEASEDGALNKSESELISNAIEFHDCEVGEVLVPRVNVVAIPVDLPMDKIKRVFLQNGYSRLPVYTDSIDHIIGMVHEKDFLNALDKGDQSITSIIKRVAIATEHMKISTLLKVFQKSKVHMAVVVDEYGGTLGIVTLEDVLEELVGEIWDEHDEVVEYFEKISEDTYRVDANADLGDFFELFSIEAEDDDFDSQTVGGWVVEKLGDMPKRNASFDFEHLHIVITRCSQRKVSELKVVVLDEEASDKAETEIKEQEESLPES